MKNLNPCLLIALLSCWHLSYSQTSPPCSHFGQCAPTSSSRSAPTYAHSVLEDQYDVNFYFLDLDIESSGSAITGNAMTQAKVVVNRMDTMALELSGFTLDSAKVALNGGPYQTAIITRNSASIYVLLPLQAHLNDAVQTRVYYHGTAATSNNFPNGAGYFTGSIAFSASPPYNSNTWWPCKQNLVDKADSSWFFITTNSTNTAVSNGLLTNTVNLGGKKRYEWKTHYPINYYLVAFAVGPMSRNLKYFHGAGRTDSMPVELYGGGDPTTALTRFSSKFGLYPFYKEKLAVIGVNLSGGIENQTMICYGGGNVVPHETMHQWFGDNVSCASFRDLALSEGFAYWGEAIYSELGSSTPATTRIAAANGYESVALSYSTGSVYNHGNDTVSISGLYTGGGYAMYYQKAACVINSMRGEINNDSLFFLGLKNYQTQMAGKAAYGSDLRDIMQATSGVPLKDFFDCWYYGYGYPTYTVKWIQKNKRLQMEVSQVGSYKAKTPVFKNYLEIKATRLRGAVATDTIVRVYIADSLTNFNFALGDSVTGLVIDPNQWIANKATVTKTPGLNLPCFIDNVQPITIQGDTLVAPLASRYQWYLANIALSGDTLQRLIARQSGVYSVKLTDNGGCTGSATLTYTCTIAGSIISQANDTLFAPASASYQWYKEGEPLTGDTLQQLIVESAGTYSVQLVSLAGCTGSATITYTCEISEATRIVQSGDTLSVQIAARYQWYKDGVALTGDTLRSLVISATGTYYAAIVNVNGCTGITDTIVHLATTIGKDINTAELSIYPNPATNILQLQASNFVPQVISIYNVDGQRVFMQVFDPRINIESLQGGIYFIEVKGDKAAVRKKIVKL